MNIPKINKTLAIIIAIVLTSVIFLIDIQTPPGSGKWVLYILPFLLLVWTSIRNSNNACCIHHNSNIIYSKHFISEGFIT